MVNPRTSVLMDTFIASDTGVMRLAKRAATDAKVAAMEAKRGSVAVADPASRSDVKTDVDVPKPPFWGSRVVEERGA